MRSTLQINEMKKIEFGEIRQEALYGSLPWGTNPTSKSQFKRQIINLYLIICLIWVVLKMQQLQCA